MQIETLEIKNYRLFRDAKLDDLPRMTVVVGAISDARPSAEAGYAEHISTRGDNVAQVAQYLYEHHRDRINRVLEAMRQRVPGASRTSA